MTSNMRETISFRPETDEDIPFLMRLYASTRSEEMKMVPWSDEAKGQFLAMQFQAQRDHYRRYFVTGEYQVIEQHGVPIGRLYVDRTPTDIHIIDIALLPEHRGRGLGRILLQEILDEAAASGRTVTIFVEQFNPARHLYDRLGFRHVDTNGIYHQMLWSAGG